jgi:hypothetical protein
MTISIVVRCIQQGFPAIGNGELPIVGFTSLSESASHLLPARMLCMLCPLCAPAAATGP